MSVSTEISRIQTDRNTIRAALVELGIATGTDNLDVLATKVAGIINQGAVSVEIKEGETYTIPKGYHNGSGTVAGVAGGGQYKLEPTKNVTPTKSQQNVTPASGFYGLEGVTVAPIPDIYQDVSSVTAGAGDVLTGKIYVTAAGQVVTGTMANNGTVSRTLDVTTITYTIPQGYHSGTGTVKITLEQKTVTPTKTAQDIVPTTGKVLSKVTVAAIPDEYITTTDADATAPEIIAGKTAYVDGAKVEGTMPLIGEVSKVLDTNTTSFSIVKGYHDGEGVVSVSLETKSVTPTKSAQNITPTAGKLLSKVSVAAIPADYITTTDANATAANILVDKTAYVKGSKVTGTMPNNGSVTATMDGLTQTSVIIPTGYTSGGTISLTSDIEDALAAI